MERPQRRGQARLKITGERLQGYLQAFLTQIAQAQAEQGGLARQRRLQEAGWTPWPQAA